MSKRLLFLLVAVLALGVTAAGCGNDEKATTNTTSSSMSHSDMDSANTSASDSGEGVESGSAELRAGLTALLEEHVYLAGIAVANGVGNGLDSGEFKAAAATLDTNSKGLAEAITSVYGDDAGEQFLSLWRDHIGFFVDYTLGKATGDTAKADEAKNKLDGYRAEFGAFIDSASDGKLPSDAVAAELGVHVDSLITAIDAVVVKSPDAFPKLQAAAAHMPMTAATLAGGIVAQMPDQFAA
jgi:hypothetical protein